MSLPVRYRVAANKDISRRARRYARIAADLSRRFLHAVAETEQSIAQAPGLGTPWHTTRKQFAHLRFQRIVGFDDVLMFYREMQNEIIISRVLHSHQDISQIFPPNGSSS